MVVPSILPTSKQQLSDQLARLIPASPWIHLDLVSGHLFPGKTISAREIGPDLIYELHLMVDRPEDRMHEYLALKPSLVWLHPESSQRIPALITTIQHKGVQVGIAVSPGVELQEVVPFVVATNTVLVMTVHPGKTGQPFLPETLTTITKLRAQFPNALIGADGGMNEETVRAARRAGANHFIAHTAVLNAPDVATALAALEEAALRGYD